MPYIPSGWASLDRAKSIVYGLLLEGLSEEAKANPDLYIHDDYDKEFEREIYRNMDVNDRNALMETMRELASRALVRLRMPAQMYDISDYPIQLFVQPPSVMQEKDAKRLSYGWIITLPDKYSEIPEKFELPEGLHFTLGPKGALTQFRRELSSGRITAAVLQNTGELTEIPSHYWNSDQGWDVLCHDVTAFFQINGSMISGRTLVDMKSIIADDENIRNYYPNSILDEEEENPSNQYIPPFISYMLKGVREMDIDSDKRIGKDVIVDWLSTNWPKNLGEKTDRKLEYMATFMRTPEAQTGGYIKQSAPIPRLPKREG